MNEDKLYLHKPIVLVDRRVAREDVTIKRVAWANESVAVLVAEDDDHVMISLITGVVLTTNYPFHYAENLLIT